MAMTFSSVASTPRLKRQSVTVRVPATSANLGPGFDCIGLALDIWNEVTVSPNDGGGLLIVVEGEGAAELPRDSSNLVVVGARAAFRVGETLAAAATAAAAESAAAPPAAARPAASPSLLLPAEDPPSVSPVSGDTTPECTIRRLAVNLCTDRMIAAACLQLAADRKSSQPRLPPLRFHCVNRIPFARGLGSSSAAVVGGLIAGLLLQGIELPASNEEALLNLACAIEGHPDNVAPAIYGGLQIGVRVPLPPSPPPEAAAQRLGPGSQFDNTTAGASKGTALSGGGFEEGGDGLPTAAAAAADAAGGGAAGGGAAAGAAATPLAASGRRFSREVDASGSSSLGAPSPPMTKWITSQVAVPADLQCLLFLPDHSSETVYARAAVPQAAPLADAIYNVSRAALLVNAFARGKLDALCVAMDDALHQPARARTPAAKHLYPLIQAALRAGAHGACLSGAGPAVLALTSGARGDIFTQRKGERTDSKVAQGMLDAATRLGLRGRLFVTRPTLHGAHVVKADPPFSADNVCHFVGGDEL